MPWFSGGEERHTSLCEILGPDVLGTRQAIGSQFSQATGLGREHHRRHFFLVPKPSMQFLMDLFPTAVQVAHGLDYSVDLKSW